MSMPLGREFLFNVYTDLSKPLHVGKGNVLYVQGWCYHTEEHIRSLTVIFDGAAHPVRNFGLARLDVFRAQFGIADMRGHSLNSGFWVMIPLQAEVARRTAGLKLSAVLADGTVCEVDGGQVRLEPDLTMEPVAVRADAAEPLVAICMATYNPPVGFLRRQIESIKRQTYRNWVCIVNDDCSSPECLSSIADCIGDDPRFLLFSNEWNLGYYHNFERILTRVPQEAAYVALADQDDRWHESKIERLLDEFDDSTTLVYSDMNIVDGRGNLISDTYWTTRKNNFSRLDLLLLANTVTGAASMFRRDLIPCLLPFPEKIDDIYHDHFIACVALSCGCIRYVDEPLYDYFQHGENVIGHYVKTGKKSPYVRISLIDKIKSIKQTLCALPAALKGVFFYYQSQYYNNFIRRIIFSIIIKERCVDIDNKNKRILDGFISTESSCWYLVYQVVRNRLMRRGPITMHLDGILLKSVLSVKLLKYYYRVRRWFIPTGPVSG